MQLIEVELAGWRPLAVFNRPVPSYAESLLSYLRPRLPPEHVKLFATPVLCGDTYRWFAPSGAPVVPISRLPEAERDHVQRSYFDTCRRISELRLQEERATPLAPGMDTRTQRRVPAVEHNGAGLLPGQRYASILSRLNLTPDRRLVFVQQGLPIRVAWGGELGDGDLFDDPAQRPVVPPKPPAPSPTRLGRLFGRTSSGEVVLDVAKAAAVRTEAEARIARQGVLSEGRNRITLMWENGCDLDLSLTAPDGQRVDFGSRRLEIAGAVAELDVDMNVSDSGSAFNRKAPVENITIDRFSLDGVWRVAVTHYKHRFPAPLSCAFRIALQFADGVRLFEGRLAPGGSRVIASIETRGAQIVGIEGGE